MPWRRWTAIACQFSENEAFTEADDIILRTAEQLSYRREGLEPETAAYLRVQSVVRVDQLTVASEWSGHVTGTAAPPPPGILVTPEEFALAEGETMTIRVRLTTQPSAPVMVATSVQALVWVFNEDGKGPPLRITRGSRLTFDTDDWDVERAVTLVAEQDRDTDDEEVSIYLDATSDDASYESLRRQVIQGTVQDDDPHRLDIVLTGSFLYLLGPQAGVIWNYNVSLAGMPNGEVRIEITSGDTGVAVVEEGRLLFFGPDNFRVPQLFRLRGVAGRNYAGATVHFEASGGGYDGVSTELIILRDDEDGLIVSDTELSISEGETGSFSVRPRTEPVHETEIAVGSWNTDTLTIIGGEVGLTCSTAWEGCDRPRSVKRLTFTREDWEEVQEVNLQAHDDDDTEDERVAVFLRAFPVDADGKRTSLILRGERASILVTVNDDDPR